MTPDTQAALGAAGIAGLTTLDVLRQARALISDPARWCRAAAARDHHLAPTFPTDPQARRWCVQGAVRRIAEDELPVFQPALRYLAQFAPNGEVTLVNDRDGHAAILALLDAAIAWLESAAVDGAPHTGGLE
jgi:hypothetical protein